MSTFNIFRGELGLGTSEVSHSESRSPLLHLIALTIILGVVGNVLGYKEVYERKQEQAEQAAAAQAEAAEREKNRERDAKIKQLNDLGMRYTYELEQERKRVFGTIQNLESYRDENTQVKKFLDQYQLPEDVTMAIREPVDLTSARSADTFEFQVQHVVEPQNLKQARAKWQALLTAAGRYAAGIERNDMYFNNYIREANIDEQFKAEFGKKPMQQQAPAVAQPQAEAEAAPVTPAEPVIEPVVAEPAAPVAEVKAAPAPKPAARPAAAPKPKTVPAGSGRVQVTDW